MVGVRCGACGRDVWAPVHWASDRELAHILSRYAFAIEGSDAAAALREAARRVDHQAERVWPHELTNIPPWNGEHSRETLDWLGCIVGRDAAGVVVWVMITDPDRYDPKAIARLLPMRRKADP